MTLSFRRLLACALALPAALYAGAAAHASKEAPVIGFSIDDLRVERWTRDRDYFVQAATAWAPRSACNPPTPTRRARSHSWRT